MAEPMLIFIHGPAAGRRVALEAEEVTIGRSTKNDLVVEDPQASRVHAIVMNRSGAILLEDLGSHNGTYLNDERIHGIRPLHHGDRILIGNSRIVFEDPSLTHDASTEVAYVSSIASDSFTQRQIQVLRLLARGLSNKQIGERLSVSERTVKAYLQAIFEKLEVQKRAAAVAAALRLGLIEMPREDEMDGRS